MGLDEALRLLGIEHGASRDRVRRAYMRKLREHPPERDPDGFQRLRSAYELAMMVVGDEPATGPEQIVVPTPIVNAEVRSDGDTTVVASAATPPVESPDPFAMLDRILDTLRSGELDEASDLAAECRRLLVDDREFAEWMPRARWVLVRELVDASPVLPMNLIRGLVDALRAEDPNLAQTAFWNQRTWDEAKGVDIENYLIRRAPALARWGLNLEAPRWEYSPLGLAGTILMVVVIVVWLAWKGCQ